jgi:RHS repeat-associated protein
MKLWSCLVVATLLGVVGACGGSERPGNDGEVGASDAALAKGTQGAKVGDSDFCDNAANLCGLGEGDCDSNAQCQSGLVCVAGNLAKRGAASGDACAPAHCGNGVNDADETSIDCGGSCGSDCTVVCDKSNGDSSKCSTDCRCTVGEGDCDSDAECSTGLICGIGNGAAFGLPVGTDVCWGTTCRNGVKDGNETAVDCGGSCAPCAPPSAGPVAVSNAGAPLLQITIAPHANGTIHQQIVDIANDLRDKLNAIVGTTQFSVSNPATNTPSGISLGIDGDFPGVGWPYQGYFRPTDLSVGGAIQPERLARLEQYVLRTPEGSNRVIVAGATVDALREAIWDLLSRVGYRHYFQSSKWEVIPRIPSLSLNLAVDEKPAFFARTVTFNQSFFSSSEQSARNAELANWQKHNRLGGTTSLNPNGTYSAVISSWSTRHGQPFPPALTTKNTSVAGNNQLCLTSAAQVNGQSVTALDAVREWAALQIGNYAISLSPNSGVTWDSTTCPDSSDATYSNVANRVAAIANAAAEAQPSHLIIAGKLSDDVGEPPTIAVDQNVFMVVDRLYTTYTPFSIENRLANWSTPAVAGGVDDFFGDGKYERPGLSTVSSQAMFDRVTTFYRQGARQYNVSEPSGWGLPGPSPWVLAQLLWDADAPLSVEDYRADFLTRAFGDAATAARKYYDVLEDHPLNSESLIGSMYRALQEGFARPNLDVDVQARLGDLAIYTRYLELYRKFWNRCSTQSSGTEQGELKELLQLIYSTRDTSMLRARDLMATIMADANVPCAAGSHCTDDGCAFDSNNLLTGAVCVMPSWNVSCPSSTQNSTCTSCYSPSTTCNATKNGAAPTLSQLPAIVAAGAAYNSVLDPALLRSFSQDLVPYTPTPQPTTLAARMPELYTILPNYLYLQRPTASGPLTVHERKYFATTLLLGRLSSLTTGQIIGTQLSPRGQAETDWIFGTADSGTYRFDVDDQGDRLFTSFPSDTRVAIPIGKNDPPLALNYRWSGYFLVPAGTQKVVGYSQADGQVFRTHKVGSTWVTDPSLYLSDYAAGHACTNPRITVNTALGKTLDDNFVIPLSPAAPTDELWLFYDSSAGAVGDRRLLNVPPYIYRAPNEVLVPREVAPETTTPQTCNATTPCPSGQYCTQAGTCRSEGGGCTSRDQCGVGDICVDGQCKSGCVGDQSCPSTNPDCTDSGECPAGMQCPTISNGWRFGKPGRRICEPPNCCEDPSDFGKSTPECGLCVCTPNCSSKSCGDADLSDGCQGRCNAVCAPGSSGCQVNSDCTAGYMCRAHSCVPSGICSRPDLAPPNCGPGTLCGPCPTVSPSNCEDRQCGTDPVTGANCGSCSAGHFCDAAGGCALLDDTPAIEVPTPTGVRPVVPDAAPAAPQLVGTVPGTFSVTDRGSASYTIPIEVAPGRAGVEPGLAFQYTSSTGNGALGIGWSIDGFSSISRCARTYAQDVVPRAVQGDIADAYCLDGKRLVLVGPNEYRTQVESFSKIVAVGDTGTGPQSFKVFTKEGRILSYGTTRNARSLLHGGVIGTWHLNREEDRSKNFLRITYEQTLSDPLGTGDAATSEIVPKAINYTGFDTEDGDRDVVFNYDTDRGDMLDGYRLGGGAFSRSKRLRSVEVRAGNQVVRHYDLSYEESPNKAQRLTAIFQCAGQGTGACQMPTGFGYYDDGGFDVGRDVSIPNEVGTSLPPPEEFLPSGVVHKSEDGYDLLTTLLGQPSSYLVTPIPPGANTAVSLFPGAGQYAAAAINIINALGVQQRTDVRFRSFTWNPVFSASVGGTYVCGVNQTPVTQVQGNGPFGAEKVIQSCPDARLVQTPGQPFPLPVSVPPRQWLVDLDGDAVQDIVYCVDDPRPLLGWGPMHLDYRLAKAATTQAPVPPSPGPHSARDGEFPLFGDICNFNEKVQFSTVMDLDNDGVGSIVAFDAKLGWAVLTYGRGWETAPVAGLTIEGNYNYYIAPVDANGDGLRDLLALPDPTKFPNDPIGAISPIINYNTGRGFTPELLNVVKDGIPSNIGGTSPKFGAYVVDMDQDGVDELAFADDATAVPWRVGRVRNGVFYNDPIPSLPEGTGVLGDFDGDGDIDAFTQAVTYEHVELPFGGELSIPHREHFRFHSGKGHRQNLLKRVVDGYQRTIDVSYDQTNSLGAVYKKYLTNDGHCAWPQRCVARPENAVVSGYVESHADPISPTTPILDRTYEFQYEGGRFDMAGYGWLGYSRRTISVEDGIGLLLGQTTIDYVDPEVWTVGTSTVPYLYLKTGLPATKSERRAVVESSITDSGSSYTRVSSNFEYTTETSLAERPFVYLSRTETMTTDVEVGQTSGSVIQVVPMVTEVGTTSVDLYGNPVHETTTRTDWKATSGGLTSLDELTTTTDEVTRNFEPTPEEFQAWLISLPKSVAVESTPRCTSQSDCNARRRQRTTTYSYFPGTDLLKSEMRQPWDQELQLTTTVTRDTRGNVTGVVSTDFWGETREAATTFDSRHLFPVTTSSIGDGVSHTTQLRFDNRFGTLIARADPNGIDETWSIDARGVTRKHRGPRGEVTSDYESASFTTTADGFMLPAVLRVVTTKAGGGHTENEIDSFGQVVRSKTIGFGGEAVHQEFAYDYRERLLVARREHLEGDLSQGEVHYSYDDLDRVITEQYPDGASVQHDYANYPSVTSPVRDWGRAIQGDSFVRHTDPRGKQTIVVSDRDGQPLRVVDAENHVTVYKYAAFGDLERITDNLERTIDFVHDDLGRLTSVTDDARGGTETTTYNAFGDIIGTMDAAARASITSYDGFGRPELREDADGTTSWVYDGSNDNEIDRLVSVTSPSGQHQVFHYEPREATRNRGFVSSATLEVHATNAPATASPRTLTTGYHYDAFSRLEKVDYPHVAGTPVSVQYTYDSYGHMTQVADSMDAAKVYWKLVSADQGFRIKEERLGRHNCGDTQPGTLTTRMYEPLTGRLQRIKTECGAAVLQDLSYGYDVSGNLKSRDDAQLSTHETFGYDSLNRPTTYSPGTGTESTRFIYDTNGLGRLQWQAGVGDYSYDTTQGRDWIQTAGSTNYQHDSVGNIIQRSGPSVPGGSQQIDYTAFDLPKQIRGVNAAAVDFEYDASGARVFKQSSVGKTFYAGDGYQRIEATAGSSERFMIYAGGRAIAQVTKVDGTSTPNIQYLHDDALGSINAVSDTAGTVSTRRSYEPFGKDPNPTTETPIGFTGQEMEDDIGLINMHGRMYDPTLGQFTSADPIMQQPYSQGLNRFAYVNNSPLNYVDPSGFASECRGRCSKAWGGGGVGYGIMAGIGAAAFAGAVAGLQAGPQALSAGGAIGATATAAGSSSPALAGGTPASSAAASGFASFGSAALSIAVNDAMFGGGPQKGTAIAADPNPSGTAKTTGAPGRGATAPDAIAPVQERIADGSNGPREVPVDQGGGNSAFCNGRTCGVFQKAPRSRVRIEITRGRLTMMPAGGSSYSMHITSGRGACMNNPSPECLGTRRVGPMVPGHYTALSYELSKPGFFESLMRRVRGDWGSFRVPLHPDAATAQQILKLNRTGDFFIHGGDMAGSAGCADCGGGVLGNSQTDRLANDLEEAPGGVVDVEVLR